MGKRQRSGPSLRSERLEPRYALSANPVGDAFLVNDFLAGEQSVEASSVAVAASETNRVVVWEGRGAVDRDGVFGRVYGADGAPLGESFRVNSTIQGEQHAPSVAVAEDGSFVVVWAGRGVNDKEGVFLQRYDTDGAALGGEITVNTTLGGRQHSPTVAMNAAGSFVVAWEGAGRGDTSGVFFRRFNASGALGSEVRANTTTFSDQRGVSVAYLDNGEFVVGWQSRRQDGSDWGVYSQQYNRVGLALGGETRLNETTAGGQSDVSLAADPIGGYVAAWQSRGQDGDGWGVVGRRFAEDGTAAGDEFGLNDSTAGDQVAPAVAVAEDGQWLAAWSSRVAGGAGWTTVTRTIEANGAAAASAIVDNGSTGSGAGHQRSPAVALVDEAAWVVWSGASGADGAGVQARDYEVVLADDGDPTAPDLAAIADRTTEVGAQIEVTVTATDANSRDTLTFTLDADNSPEGATIEQIGNDTAVVRWTPEEGDDDQTFEFRVVVTDDGDQPLSDAETFSVSVVALPATVDLNGPETDGTAVERDFIVGDAAVRSLAPNLTIAGAEDGELSGATARLLAAPEGDDELLSVQIPSSSSVTADYDAATRTLTLSGEASASEYRAILRTLIYVNNADTPTGERMVAVSVTDAEGDGPVANATVTIVQPDLVAFAEALADAGVELTGGVADPETTQQRALFQDGRDFLPFTATTDTDATPTWTFAGGMVEGFLTLAQISTFSGVAIPTSQTPTVAPIEDTTLLVGSPLMLALDGYDPNGGPLTYTVTSDNPDITAEVLTGNRSLRISTANNVDAGGGDYGEMTFQLFEGRATRATDRVIELADDGFYDDLAFHRVVEGFAIQGGDPNGDGTGGSSLGNFDDDFDPDLQHNRSGLLSFAKSGANPNASTSGDDTNDSQFFITDGDNTDALRNLDYNHSVFGLLVEGDSTRQAISEAEVEANAQDEVSRPVNTIRMDRVEVFNDTENAVVMLEAADGATGTANLTVTVTDQDGNSSQRTFTVTLEDDTVDSRPFLEDVPEPITGTQDTPVTFEIDAIDVEGDEVTFFARRAIGETESFDVEVDDDGRVTVTPPDGFTGTLMVEVSVHRGEPVSLDGDFQVVPVTFS